MGYSIIQHDVLGVVIMRVISRVDGMVAELMEAEGFDPKNIDVKLIINGIEVDAKETLEDMWTIHEEAVAINARGLIEEHMSGLMHEISEEISELSHRMKAKLPWSEID